MIFRQNPTEERVSEALVPVIQAMGAQLYEVEWNGGLLKLTVDVEGGASTDKLAEVHRLVYPLVEQQNLVGSNFSLEVTSPGLERQLTTLVQFEMSVGKNVSIRKSTKPHHIMGELVSVDNISASFNLLEVNDKPVDEELIEIPIEDISKAKTVFDWKSALSEDK